MLNTGAGFATTGLNQPVVFSKNYLLIDARTGVEIVGAGENEKRPIASLTKIMTAVLTISEVKNLKNVAVATNYSTNAGESEIYLEPGEKIKIENLLYALMLRSANDAALALAESVSGNESLFVALMNKKAREIGALNTSFKNPHGLDEPGHYSTAADIGKIALYAMSFPEFRKIVSTKEATITWENRPRIFKAYNHNKLLFRLPFVKGIKTGYTRKAGHCLVTYAEKNGKKLICVVLNEPSAAQCYEDTVKLLNYGFSVIRPVTVVQKGEKLKKPVFYKGKKYQLVPYVSVTAELPANAKRSEFSFDFVPYFKSGQKSLYGVLKVFYKGKLIALSTADAFQVR